MNRQEMQEQIELYVPSLADEQKERWKNAEKLRLNFVRDYSPAKIQAMQLDDFVIGKGFENRSFCYRLEREMDDLGSILGSTAIKFGVYYSKELSQYEYGKKWGRDLNSAFLSLKTEIMSLLEAASQRDINNLNKNKLSPMLKGKILFVYHPEEYIPIYSQDHLNFFVAELNLHSNPKSSVEMQRALMEYRATWRMLMEQSPVLFMHFLYQIFPQVKKPSNPVTPEGSSLPLLDQAILGARFIEQMPFISAPKTKPSEKEEGVPKINYIEQQKQRKRIGNRGEAIVKSMEEKRLQDEGRPDLAIKIEHISDKSDKEGYDILSFDTDGTPRHIEVKATSASSLDRGFYISSNELEKSMLLPNYYIYFVFSTMSKNPRILSIPQPNLKSSDYNLDPVAYHVMVHSAKSDEM